jgi:hypothetical protein
MKSIVSPRSLIVVAAGLLGLHPGHAAVVITPTVEQQPSPFAPSWGNTVAANVLSGLTPTSSLGTQQPYNTAGVSALTDGVTGPISAYEPDPYPTAFTKYVGTGPGAISQVTYSLGATGLQLSSIGVYGGWIDTGRDSQAFTVSYSTDHGTSFQTLAVTTNPVTATYGHDQSVATRTIVTDDTGALAGGALITDLRFDFTAVENTWTGTSEITAVAVPEPGVALLSLVGVLGTLRRRRA